ncbi:protein transport protein SEC31-like [Humulus lupulus]|uniref:protein transport protein SEC31-like n=1 Tax=Humulus lupulus TaxID=3486 RepID=UPI002B409B3A|nr:protein transport protein SEC31-like [Humulus lupulus]
MKQRANRRRTVVQPSPVVAATVSPPPKMAVPSSVDASEPSVVATSPNRVVSPNSDPSLAMAIVLVPPTVAEMSPSPPSTSLPEVVTASAPPVSPTVGVVNAHLPCSVGKSSPPVFVSSPKCVTHSSVVSTSPPGESSQLPNPNPPSPSPPKSPSMSKQSSPNTPKTRSAFKSKPKPKPHVHAQSKGKGKVLVSSPPKNSSAPKRKPKDTQFEPSPKKSKRASSPKDSVSFVDPSFIQYFSRHWVNTVSKLVSPHPILIREFYANLDRSVLDGKNEDCLTAFVRGSRIKFAPSTIAHALKVPKVLKPAYNKSYSPDQSTMGQVLTGLPDYVWGNHDIPITKLTHFYRVLHRVALYNWFPNSHLSSVTLEIGKFLYAMGTGVSIDLSTLIYDRIFDLASSTGTRNKLPYPSLI